MSDGVTDDRTPAEKMSERIAARNKRNAERFDKAAVTLVTVLLNDPTEWFTVRDILALIGTWTPPLVIGRYEAMTVLRTLSLGVHPLVKRRPGKNHFSEWQIDHVGVRQSKYQPELCHIEHEQRRQKEADAGRLIRPTKTKR
jgi:hypothetical protein